MTKLYKPRGNRIFSCFDLSLEEDIYISNEQKNYFFILLDNSNVKSDIDKLINYFRNVIKIIKTDKEARDIKNTWPLHRALLISPDGNNRLVLVELPEIKLYIK